MAPRGPQVGPALSAGNGVELSPAATDASIRSAALFLYAIGGGTVRLPVGSAAGSWSPITLLSALPWLSGVSYKGVPSVTTAIDSSAGQFEDGFSFVGGTVLQGDGTFAAFEGNITDLASPAGDVGTTSIKNAEIYGVGLDNFTYGIRAGANNVMGIEHSQIRQVMIRRCSVWGIALKNFMYCDFGHITSCLCQNGQYYGVFMPAATMGPTNTYIEHLYNLLPRDGRDNRLCRGIQFEVGATGATQGGMGSLVIARLQNNAFNVTKLSVTATFANTSTDVAVPDGTKFLPGHLVRFTATGQGFTANQIYYVKAVSGNNLTLGASRLGASIAATGNGTLTLETYGFAGIEWSATNAASSFIGHHVIEVDSEANSSAHLYLENVTGSSYHVAGGSGALTDIVGRNVATSEIRSPTATVDFDSACSTSRFYGSKVTQIGTRLPGLGYDAARAAYGLNIYPQALSGFPAADLEARLGGWLYPAAGIGERIYPFNSTFSMNGTQAGDVIFNDSTPRTMTLPTIVTDTSNGGSALVGIVYEFVNVGTAVLTVATDGAQLFNLAAGVTSFTVPPGQTLKVTAAKNIGGTLFWVARRGGLAAESPWRHEIIPALPPATQTTFNGITYTACIGGVVRDGTGAQNSTIGWDIVLDAGTWDFSMFHRAGPARGIYTVSIDGVSIGTIDGYLVGDTLNTLTTISGFTVAVGGKKRLALTMATKNGSSSGYYPGVQLIGLQRTA